MEFCNKRKYVKGGNDMSGEKKLTSRAFALYEFLKKQNGWVTQRDIALQLPSVYPCRVEDMEDFHNSAARHCITDDIRTLNNSGMIQKIILSGARGVKIASEEEFDAHIGKMINAAVRRLQRVKKIAEKGNRDGQMKIKLGAYERECIEAFIK